MTELLERAIAQLKTLLFNTYIDAGGNFIDTLMIVNYL